MWTDQATKLILASASPRRLDLLRQIQIPVEPLVVPTTGEDEPRLPNEHVVDYVQRTSLEKNTRAQQYVVNQRPDLIGLPILSADTTVALGETILGKPQDAADAKNILTRLADKHHDVYTAVTLWHGQFVTRLVRAQVRIAPCILAVIDEYVDSHEPFGKAGAYGIQGIAAAYISEVNGSYSAVVGLPLFETAEMLRTLGLYQ